MDSLPFEGFCFPHVDALLTPFTAPKCSGKFSLPTGECLEDMLLFYLELGSHLFLQALSSLMGHNITLPSLLVPVLHGRN